MPCLNGAAAAAGQTPAIAAKERSGEAVAEELRSGSLPLLLPHEWLLVRRYWERWHRRLVAGEGAAVILPAPEAVLERMKEVEGAVRVVTTVRQTMVAAVLGRLAEQEPTRYWRMVYGSWAAEAASSLLEEAGPSTKPMRWAVRLQLSF